MALILRIISALHMGIPILQMQGDSRLTIQQVSGEFFLEEIPLIFSRTVCLKLVRSFSSVQFKHMSRAHNKRADALANLALKIDIPD